MKDIVVEWKSLSDDQKKNFDLIPKIIGATPLNPEDSKAQNPRDKTNDTTQSKSAGGTSQAEGNEETLAFVDIDGNEIPELEDLEEEDQVMQQAGSHTETEMDDFTNPEQPK